MMIYKQWIYLISRFIHSSSTLPAPSEENKTGILDSSTDNEERLFPFMLHFFFNKTHSLQIIDHPIRKYKIIVGKFYESLQIIEFWLKSFLHFVDICCVDVDFINNCITGLHHFTLRHETVEESCQSREVFNELFQKTQKQIQIICHTE